MPFQSCRPVHTLPWASHSTHWNPDGNPGLLTESVHSLTSPVETFRRPTMPSAKSWYQIAPVLSGATSWGSAFSRGKLYSVMMTFVSSPCGRGNIFNSKSCFGCALKLMEARYLANSSLPNGAPPLSGDLIGLLMELT